MIRRGLVIGKFMPVHHGHIALIEFAAAHCESLIVSMSYTANDPIPQELRFAWLREIFREHHTISLVSVLDDFDNDALPLEDRTKVWSEFIRNTYGNIDGIFASEPYGEPLAGHLGATYKPFDPERHLFPVSASDIRLDPFRFWNFIPRQVRPFFVRKICFYGPESTGKSTLARQMAALYNTTYVPEVARDMLTSNDFSVEDIIAIGRAHHERIQAETERANKILFCDTDVITTQIYSRHYLKVIPEELFDLEQKVKYDLYFLMDIDIPWVYDGLRDLGDDRARMLDVFKKELVRRDIPYVPVSGSFQERAERVTKAVDLLLSSRRLQ